MKLVMTLLRIWTNREADECIYRLAVHRHYESGHGHANNDPRALAASAIGGVIASDVEIIRQWKPFDFGLRGGLLLDLDDLIEDEFRTEAGYAQAMAAARYFLRGFSTIVRSPADPISDDPALPAVDQ